MRNLESDEKPLIGWVISGDKSVASSRLQGFNVHDYLVSQGLDSEIICTDFNKTWQGYSSSFLRLARKILKRRYDVVLFERPNWMMYKLSELVRTRKTKTVAIRCDPLPGPYDTHFDLTVVPTEGLAKILELDTYRVIDDMIEVPQETYKKNYDQLGERLRIVWVGHGSYKTYIQDFAVQLGEIKSLKERIEFVTISKGDWATYPWSLDTVYEHIIACDVAIIPMPKGERYQAKSTNRLTMCMALGMPTIASPIPPYVATGKVGQICLFADTIPAFGEALSQLESRPLREQLGVSARIAARRHYNRDIIGAEWLEMIRTLDTATGRSGGMKAKLLGQLLRV